MNTWQSKLLAFLHDPPHKALDIAGHEAAREAFVRQAGFTEAAAMQWFDRPADWWAAAADRCPAFTRSLRSPFGGSDHPFLHPLGGSSLMLEEFSTPELLGGWLQDVQPREAEIPAEIAGEERDRINFFLHWRRWPVESARKDWRAALQPADTRMPDHPIWLHNGVASAIQGAELKPAFLLFQFGPVQDFIAQARSTRDLWSGSYLISWLMAHALKAVTDRVGPDAVIFPFLRAQPLFDLLHRDFYRGILYNGRKGGTDTMWDRLKVHAREMLVPNLPNRFLALVPADEGRRLAEAAKTAVSGELGRIAEACWSWIDKGHPLALEWRERFDRQIAAFPQMAWQVLPWNLDPASWPTSEELYGCAPAYPPNAGLAWSRHYANADRLLAARRNTRDFPAWMRDEKGLPLDPNMAGTAKDFFSGKEEIIGGEQWWTSLPRTGELACLFRSDDQLGAMNLVKKVWHRAYLDAEPWGLKTKQAIAFDSVPDVAAREWLDDFRRRALEALRQTPAALDRLVAVAQLVHRHAPDWNIRAPESPPDDRNIDQWLEAVAPEAFLESEWKRKKEEQPEVRAALRALYRDEAVKLGKPPAYVAVIAFDGDEMGKWVSGEKTPPLIGQMSLEARAALQRDVGERRRPLSPSYHLQFSEALANFSAYLARPVVEHFKGDLIYSGGDDVLCMVPAARALDCAEALRAAFQGSRRLCDLVPGAFEVLGSNGGFVRLASPKGEQPTWALIVPGPAAEASAGIAIGHMHAPLQGLVRAAREAEKRAKSDLGRAAFAVNVYKRSGEILAWGAPWDSGAIELHRAFFEASQAGRLSGTFAYALGELLAPYESRGAVRDAPGFDARAVIRLELDRVLDRQTAVKGEEKRNLMARLRELAATYLDRLGSAKAVVDFPMLFRTAAFILRGERE